LNVTNLVSFLHILYITGHDSSVATVTCLRATRLTNSSSVPKEYRTFRHLRNLNVTNLVSFLPILYITGHDSSVTTVTCLRATRLINSSSVPTEYRTFRHLRNLNVTYLVSFLPILYITGHDSSVATVTSLRATRLTNSSSVPTEYQTFRHLRNLNVTKLVSFLPILYITGHDSSVTTVTCLRATRLTNSSSVPTEYQTFRHIRIFRRYSGSHPVFSSADKDSFHRRWRGWVVNLATHLYQVQKLRMTGVIPPSPSVLSSSIKKT